MPEWGNPKEKLKWLKEQFGGGADFFQQTGEEFEFQRFLVSRFGSMGALAIRAQYTFRDITQSPPYKEWVRLGKPQSIEELPAGQRGRFDELVAKKPIDPRGETVIPFQFQRPQIAALERGKAKADEPPKMFQGFTPEEWALGIPGFQLDRQRAEEARRQFDIQFGQKQADIMNQQRANELAGQAQASQNIAQMAFGGGTFIGERNAQNAYKAQLAKQFEDTMRDILSTTAPRDWVVRAKAQQALENNPFAPASQTFGDQFDAASQNEAFYKTSLESKKRDIENARRDPRISVTDQDMQEFAALEIKLDLAKKQRQAAEKRFIESDEPQFAEARPTAFGGFEVGRPSETAQPKEIGIPKELSQAFGITKFGQTPLRPSGQQWNRATFTAREQLAGYNEALGANWSDVLDQMSMERPQNLTLGRTWQPARSMI